MNDVELMMNQYFGINNPGKFSPSVPVPIGQLYHYMESRRYVELQKKLVHALTNPTIEDIAWIGVNYDILENIAETLGMENPDFSDGIPIDIASDLASKIEWRIKTTIDPVLKSEYPTNYNHEEVFGYNPLTFFSESTQEYFLKKYSWMKSNGQKIDRDFVVKAYQDLGW